METLIRVGLIGTGFAARLRAEALAKDARSHLVAVAGSDCDRAAEFCAPFGASSHTEWQALVDRHDVDLVVVANASDQHGDIVERALQAEKPVAVEYPLSLDLAQAQRLIALAREKGLLLHVEHIELLGGQHRAAAAHLAQIGQPHYARYCTLNPQRPAPRKWTYQPARFGFPLVGALSRIHRLTDLFGQVEQVFCQNHYDWAAAAGSEDAYITTCLCTAQLHFSNGLLAEVTYGKGESIWAAARRLEIHGTAGGLIFDGDQGQLITAVGEQALELGSRRGLFAKDTAAVLSALLEQTPLYVRPEASLYALQVADAARRSATTGTAVKVSVESSPSV
ncbi:MAG TPA: Gfo/Idh/MocA family oxidoreductase [Trichocoleus sp.]